ncbi:MAG: hypothetical protein WC527_00830 [Candidatus Margulisiibacteriota bacterium]
MANRVLATYSTAIHPNGYLARQDRMVRESGYTRITDISRQGVTVSQALREGNRGLAFQINRNFLSRYQSQIDWFTDRLYKSTAGVRGLTLDISRGLKELDAAKMPIGPERRTAVRALLESAYANQDPEFARQLSMPVVAFVAQAYSAYIRQEFPTDQQGAFINHDGRYFLDQFCKLSHRIVTGNGMRAVIDLPGNITETPVSSYMAWHFGLASSFNFTASHNDGAQGAFKSGNENGGVDTDVESEKIASYVRYLYNGGRGRGWIVIGPEDSRLLQVVDAKQIYWDDYLSKLLSPDAIAMIKASMGKGSKFLVDGLWGALGPAAEFYLDRLLPDIDWRASVIIMNNKPAPHMGGVERPDPSEPATLEQTGVLEELASDPRILLSVSGDKDADRTGPAVIVPAESVPVARKFGLYTTKMVHKGNDVNIIRFTPQQIFALNTYNRILDYFEKTIGTRDVNKIREEIAAGRVDTSKMFILSTLPTSRIFHALAKMFGMKLVLTSVGFKYQGMLAKRIEDEYGSDAVIFSENEESGGANVGLLGDTDPKGAVIQKDKSTIAQTLSLIAASARCDVENRNLVDLYVEMAEKLGNLFYYERMDTYLPNMAAARSLEPDVMANADAIKAGIAAKMFALEEPENREQLAALFGYKADQIVGTGTKILDDAYLVLADPANEQCQLVNPEVLTTTFNDGVEMQVFHAGVPGKEGPIVTFYDKDGNFLYMSCLRLSGTESLMRHYKEVAEPFEGPNPLHLISRFDALDRHLGFDQYGTAEGGTDYLTAFAETVTKKYGQQ